MRARITEQQRWQGIHAFDPEQGLQAIEQDVLDERDHLALDGCALDVVQQVDDPKLLQKVEEVIQQRALVQPVDSVNDLLRYRRRATRESSGEPLANTSVLHVLLNYFQCLSHGPPPSEVAPFL